MVGELLLSRYMIGFEGAAFLILAGIAGAVILARREQPPVPSPTTQQAETPGTTETQMYTCPMHPDVRQPEPGNCPKCGMELISVQEHATGAMQAEDKSPQKHQHGGHA